jgi:NadR type nicotinamide-nucleotide adenylyltransferase
MDGGTMKRALVLMKAMPPTKGHERLIGFAKSVCDRGCVLMDTAPDEPMINARWQWLAHQVDNGRGWYANRLILDDQNPESEGFWERWKDYIDAEGRFDYVIGSENYCAKVAEVIGARYIPYDPDRELNGIHAAEIRDAPLTYFGQISDSFKRHMQLTVTVWGAESTGKTTLSKQLAYWNDGEWLFEWARPYLEATGRTVCDLNDMQTIWHGQFAAEEVQMKSDKAFLIRDTDLYSTIGYWEQPHWKEQYGPVPDGLVADAKFHKSDLYVITSSDIPFEKDPLRYGGDHRESTDDYWLSVANRYELP